MIIHSLLLAAGSSKRLGEINKLLLKSDEMTLVRRSVLIYKKLSSIAYVVTGYDHKGVQAVLNDIDIHPIFNAQYDMGRQSSVYAGLSMMNLDCDGVLIGLADQYLINERDIECVIDEFKSLEGQKVVIPIVDDTRGHPIIIPNKLVKRFLNELEQQDKETVNYKKTGLRAFLDQNDELIHWFHTKNDHYIRDIDTPEDMRAAGLSL